MEKGKNIKPDLVDTLPRMTRGAFQHNNRSNLKIQLHSYNRSPILRPKREPRLECKDRKGSKGKRWSWYHYKQEAAQKGRGKAMKEWGM